MLYTSSLFLSLLPRYGQTTVVCPHIKDDPRKGKNSIIVKKTSNSSAGSHWHQHRMRNLNPVTSEPQKEFQKSHAAHRHSSAHSVTETLSPSLSEVPSHPPNHTSIDSSSSSRNSPTGTVVYPSVLRALGFQLSLYPSVFPTRYLHWKLLVLPLLSSSLVSRYSSLLPISTSYAIVSPSSCPPSTPSGSLIG
jgi:hypothetical protein